MVTLAPTLNVVGAVKFEELERWIWKPVSLLALSVQVSVTLSCRVLPVILTAAYLAGTCSGWSELPVAPLPPPPTVTMFEVATAGGVESDDAIPVRGVGRRPGVTVSDRIGRGRGYGHKGAVADGPLESGNRSRWPYCQKLQDWHS